MSAVTGNTFLIRTANGRFDMLSVSRASLIPAPVTINSVTASASPNTYPFTAADVNGTSTTNGVNYKVYSFTSVSTTTTYTVNYSCSSATTIYVLAVGGGGCGGLYAGSGGGAGGVVMMPLQIPAGTNTISISIGAGAVSAGTTNISNGTNGTNGFPTTVTFSGSVTPPIITAGGGGGGGGYGNGGTPVTGFGGSAGGGTASINSSGNNNGYNYANGGGFYLSNNVGECGGGGAGTPGMTNTAAAGYGAGGNGIQCFLPGINNFSPSGTAYGTYYWGGGGAGGYGSGGIGGGNGGLGGGGGGAAAGTTGGGSGLGYGFGGGFAINSGSNGGTTATGNGGNAGANTGGGGGGSSVVNGPTYYGGNGGSGIVIIAFPTYTVSSNQSAVLPASIVSSGLYSATLNNASLSSSAYSSIKGAYASRLLNYNYFGPVMTLRHSLDTTGLYTQNFYSDICGNLGTSYLGTGQSVSNWLSANGANTTYAFVTKWYNQGMDVSFNSATQYKISAQPTYDVANGVLNYGYTGAAGGVAAIYPAFMNLPTNSMPFGQNDSSFTVVTRFWNWGTTQSDTQADLISCYTSGNLGHIVFNYNGSPSIAVQNLNNTLGPTLATSNGVISYKYISRSTTLTNQSYVYQNNVAGTTLNSTAAVTFTPGALSIGNYTSDINANGYMNAGNFTSNPSYYLQAQLYNLYVFSSALTDADRNLIEATPYQYSAPPAITGIASSSVTNTSFALTSSAVTNATTFIIYVNGSYNTTVVAVSNALPSTTIVPGGYGPWQATVYAYNASNVCVGLSNVDTLMTSALGYYPLNSDFKNYALATPVADGTNTGTPTFSTTLLKVGYGSCVCSTGNFFAPLTSFSIPASITTTNGQYTWSVWFNTTSANWTSAPMIFALTVNGSPGYLNTNNILQVYINTSGNLVTYGIANSQTFTNGTVSSLGALSLNTWYHLTFTMQYNNATSTGATYTYYLNGVQIYQTTGYFIQQNGYFTSFGGANTSLNGNIDDCRIYNRILTQSEIMYLYYNIPSLTTPFTGVKASSITSSGCTLTWSGGSGNGVTYTYSSIPAGAVSVSTSSPATITGLTAGKAYSISVNAVVGGVTVQSAPILTNWVAISAEQGNMLMGATTQYQMDCIGMNDAGTKVVGGNSTSSTFFYLTFNGTSWSAPATFTGANTNSYYTGALTADGTRGVIGNSFFTWTGATPSALTSFGTAPSGGKSYTKLTADGSRLLMQSGGTMGFYTWNGTTYANFTSVSLTNLNTSSTVAISPTGTYIAYTPSATNRSIYFATWNGTTYANETLNVNSEYSAYIASTTDVHDFNFGCFNVLYMSITSGGYTNIIALGYNPTSGYFDSYFGLKLGVGAPGGGIAAPKLTNNGTLLVNFTGWFYSWQLAVK